MELKGILPVSGQMGSISNRSSLPAVSCALQLVLGFWGPGGDRYLSHVLREVKLGGEASDTGVRRHCIRSQVSGEDMLNCLVTDQHRT